MGRTVLTWVLLALLAVSITRLCQYVLVFLVTRRSALARGLAGTAALAVLAICIVSVTRAFFDPVMGWLDVALTTLVYGYVGWNVAMAAGVALLMPRDGR